MKQIINKITNKDRLVKLYGCSECGGELRWYGMAPHNHDLSKGTFIGSTKITGEYPDNFVPDPETIDEKGIAHQGTWYCTTCNGKGYTINRDSQVLDIVYFLITARMFYPHKDIRGKKVNLNLAQALIKLIELAYDEDQEIDIENNYFVCDTIDHSLVRYLHLIVKPSPKYNKGVSCLNAFCNHHKIEVWASVAEILEGEE